MERRTTRQTSQSNNESDSEISDPSTQSSQESTTILHPIEEEKEENEASGVDAESRIYKLPALPDGVDPFDKDTADDIHAEPYYVMDIFNYYKEREVIN